MEILTFFYLFHEKWAKLAKKSSEEKKVDFLKPRADMVTVILGHRHFGSKSAYVR